MEFSELAGLVMNPVRQRIIQYLILHGEGTAKEMQAELSDIPVASLYRHIKKLYTAGCIRVTEERSVRGAVEKTYALVEHPFSGEPQGKELGTILYSLLLSLQTTFLQYFEREDADAKRDMLLMQSTTLLLTDEEFAEFLQKLGECFAQVAQNKPKEGRRQRRITFISSPGEET